MLEVITGCMFSGKTEELLRRIRRSLIADKNVLVFKSKLDNRYEGVDKVCTHNNVCVEATPVGSAKEIQEAYLRHQMYDQKPVDVVAIDEAEFFQKEILDVVDFLAETGTRVIVVGTDMDFRGCPFGCMPELMAIAEKVTKLNAICMVCGGTATRNQRLVDGEPAFADGPTILIGGPETYEARCRTCHEVR